MRQRPLREPRINLPSSVMGEMGKRSQWKSAWARIQFCAPHPTKTALGGAASELLPLARIKAEKVGQPAQPLVFQPALHQLAGLLIQHGHLLVACMQITTYNL